MRQTTLYLVLAIPGLLAPWFFLLGFFGGQDRSPSLFLRLIFANDVASAVAVDLLVSALVFFCFVAIEGRRVGMKHRWVYVPLTLGVGLSLGLPLFLYFRACALPVVDREGRIPKLGHGWPSNPAVVPPTAADA